jgi:hypothetical protein
MQLSADVRRILGEDCLTGIMADGSGSHHRNIDVRDAPVFGFQVSYGTYGVVALRVLYDDESTSPWLGIPLALSTTYRCKDLKQLRTFSDVSVADFCVSSRHD